MDFLLFMGVWELVKKKKKKSNILKNPYAKEKQENNIILEQLFWGQGKH